MKTFILTLVACHIALAAQPLYFDLSNSDHRESLTESVLSSEDLIVKCPSGFTLPVDFQLSGDLFSYQPASDRGQLAANRDFYMRRVNGVYQFSTDMESWKEIEEFTTGQLGITFSPDQLTFGGHLDLRTG